MSEMDIVKNDWKIILQKDEEFTDRFYENLFELDPELKSLFKRSMRMQGRKVLSMFDIAIGKIDQPLKMMPPLMAAGARHLQYNVKNEHYLIMRDAFLKTIADIFGDAFDKEREYAWRTAFNLITNIMIGSSVSSQGTHPRTIKANG